MYLFKNKITTAHVYRQTVTINSVPADWKNITNATVTEQSLINLQKKNKVCVNIHSVRILYTLPQNITLQCPYVDLLFSPTFVAAPHMTMYRHQFVRPYPYKCPCEMPQIWKNSKNINHSPIAENKCSPKLQQQLCNECRIPDVNCCSNRRF